MRYILVYLLLFLFSNRIYTYYIVNQFAMIVDIEWKNINDDIFEGYCSKTASNLKKPNGLKILFRDALPHKIKKLKLSDLTGIGKRMERRLILANVQTINDLYKLSPKNMRTIWGSVQGERFWNMLRGNDIEEITTKTSTIGHSHVLHPNWRKPDLAKHILNRLVLKAASRLRRKRYFCKKIKTNKTGAIPTREAAIISFHLTL